MPSMNDSISAVCPWTAGVERMNSRARLSRAGCGVLP
jgi:hypothetical protein